MSRSEVLSYLCIFIGYSTFGIFALSLRFPFEVPTEAYWLSFVLVSIPPLYDIAFWGDNPKRRLVYLLSFSLMIHLQYAVVDNSPLLLSIDAVADYRLTEIITTGSGWLSSVQFSVSSEYSLYPITNFIYTSLSTLTGIPLLLVVKYLFVTKAIVMPPLVDRWFKSFFPHRVAYLATMILLASPGAILFPHKESFAVIFFVLGIYASSKFAKSKQYLLIGLISIVTLVMTHHFTSYIFLGLLTSVFLAGFVSERPKTRMSTQFIMFCWVAFLAWVAFVAQVIVSRHQELLSGIFLEYLLPGQLAFSELMPLYTSLDRIVIYLGFGITAISAGLGFLSYARDGKTRSSGFLAISLFLMPLLVVASVFRFYPGRLNVLVSHRAFEFGYIAVGAFSALFFVRFFQSRKKLTPNVILICSVVLVIITGPMAGAMRPGTFARLSGVVSFRGLSMNAWMSEFAPEESAIGDRVVYVLVMGYGDTRVIINPELFVNEDYSLPPEAPYIVTYVYMTDFYGPNAAKFDNSPYFHNVYTNGLLSTYGISNRTSSHSRSDGFYTNP